MSLTVFFTFSGASADVIGLLFGSSLQLFAGHIHRSVSLTLYSASLGPFFKQSQCVISIQFRLGVLLLNCRAATAAANGDGIAIVAIGSSSIGTPLGRGR